MKLKKQLQRKLVQRKLKSNLIDKNSKPIEGCAKCTPFYSPITKGLNEATNKC